jgi:hypothetical protein
LPGILAGAAALLATGGIDFGVAFRLAASTLPPAAFAGTALLGEKSPGFEVAATAGLPPLFFTRN